MTAIVCPECRADVPSADLHRFLRFYDRDTGFVTCGCGAALTWTLRIKAKKRHGT